MSDVPPAHGPAWKWWVCVLLLLATMLNYMDRQTLSQTATAINRELNLSHEQYGQIERNFGFAFALGALLVGWSVDRWTVRWVYPAVVLAWSAAGFATGFARDLADLLLFRSFLGLAEGGNPSCSLRTTQLLLPPAERTLGNSILQSGASIGAVLTPLVVLALVSEGVRGSWRGPFFVIGVLGIAWTVLWLALVRRGDLALPPPAKVITPQGEALPSRNGHGLWREQIEAVGPILADVRFWVLVVVVVVINTTWHYFRAWLPMFLQEDHHYTLAETNWFSALYYAATDAGSLASGFAALALARRGWTVHGSRLAVFLACALLTLLSIPAALLPRGYLLLGLLLVVGFGALGLFPVYYSLTQEITVRHQGKVNGLLGCINWVVMAQLHPLIGRLVDRLGSHALGVALVGTAPLVGFVALAFFWKSSAEKS